jgi:hypothetical protein
MVEQPGVQIQVFQVDTPTLGIAAQQLLESCVLGLVELAVAQGAEKLVQLLLELWTHDATSEVMSPGGGPGRSH